MTSHRLNQFFFLLIIGLLAINCSPDKEKSKTVALGNIELAVTSSKDAVKHFESGVLLLHSFMYSDAALSFQKAQKADPDFAMAYWGEAMTQNHPLWSEQNYDRGVTILSTLGDTKDIRLAKAPTELEKDFLTGVEIMYGQGSKIERDDTYAEHMAQLFKKYPGNHEIAAFYTLALLGSVEAGRDYDVYGKGAKIAQGILKENPNHPGALHYMIHSYDDPDHAPLAIEAANNYSKVAPDAGHALHMPSHIYIALGMWDEVIASNIRSYQAKLKKVAKDEKLGWNLHAYRWLLYAYLQKNDLENANRIMENMVPYIESNTANYTRFYAIEMFGNYMAETGNWNSQFFATNVKTEDLNVQSKASKLFLEGYVALQNNDTKTVQSKIQLIDDEIVRAENKIVTKGITVCSGVGFASRSPSQNDLDHSRLLALELKVGLAELNGESDENVELLMKQATNLESSISFNFGPPSIVLPSYELFGNWLLRKGRYEDAIVQFDKSLKKGPKRRLALTGKLEAARKLGDQDLITELENELTPKRASS